jgi:hypothetical protein
MKMKRRHTESLVGCGQNFLEGKFIAMNTILEKRKISNQ